MARIVIRLAIGIVLLAGSLGAFRVLQENRPRPAQIADAASARLVSVVEAQSLPIARRFSGFGTTRAIRETTLAAEISARVTSRPEVIRAGQPVAQGDVIVRLNPEVFRQRVASAEGAMGALEADLKAVDVDLESTQERIRLSDQAISLIDSELAELERALERGAAVQIEVDRLRRQRTSLELEREGLRQVLAGIPSRRASLEARLSAQRAELALAQIDLDRSNINAPISGILAEIYVDEGDSVAPGTPICRIVDLDVIEVPLQLPASAATQVSPGAGAIIREPGVSGRRYEGTVVRIAPEINRESRTITVFVEVRQRTNGLPSAAAGMLLPGQFVSGEVIAAKTRESLAIPRLAVMSDRVMVFEPESGTAQPRTAPVDYYTDRLPQSTVGEWEQWAILNPTSDAAPWQAPRLKAGELVIVSNLDELPPGTRVRLQDDADRTAAR